MDGSAKDKNDVIEGRYLSHSLADLLSGSLAGCANVLVGLPFDTLKVKMQTYPSVYPSFPSAAIKTFQNEGILRGFYSGYGPSLAANIGENAVLFYAYGWCREWALPQIFGIPSTAGPFWNAVAGSMASTFSSLVLCPTEMVKCRLQVQRQLYMDRKRHVNAFEVINTIWREGGARGFYRGLSATWAREWPGYFALFLGYEGTKSILLSYQEKDTELGVISTVLCGGTGGFTYWLFVFPMDVIKSRIQVKGDPNSVLNTGINILRNEGMRRMYKGVSAALLRSFPSTGALFLTYETSNRALKELLTEV